MAARVKSLASMLLLVGVLGILTVSAWAEDVEVTFMFYQTLDPGKVLKITGNSSVLGDWDPDYAPQMISIGLDAWGLTVILTAGEAYGVKLMVDHCDCKPNETHVFTVPIESPHYSVELTSYDCYNACPNPTENVEVTFLFYQNLDLKTVLKIVGNTSVLGNSNPDYAPQMISTGLDNWAFTVKLTAGEAYELRLMVGDCYCTRNPRYFYTAELEDDHKTHEITGFDCDIPCSGSFAGIWKMFNLIRRFSNVKQLV